MSAADAHSLVLAVAFALGPTPWLLLANGECRTESATRAPSSLRCCTMYFVQSTTSLGLETRSKMTHQTVCPSQLGWYPFQIPTPRVSIKENRQELLLAPPVVCTCQRIAYRVTPWRYGHDAVSSSLCGGQRNNSKMKLKFIYFLKKKKKKKRERERVEVYLRENK
jgi:hypothetical protein